MRLGVRLAAACLLAAAAGTVPLSTASAATCASADGVSVVVDFHELGGGVQTACVADGGGQSAASLLTAAGFGLTYVQRQPGFVCRVSGLPSTDPCVNTPPADAYWGFWWSDGKSGAWTYATTSVGSLKAPDGGYVALSWNGSAGRSTPGIAPAVHPAAPTPTPKPTKTPTSTKTAKPTSAATPRATSTNGAASQSQTPGETPTTSASPSAVETTPSGAAGKPTKSPGGVDGEMLPEDGPSSQAAASAVSDPADPADDGGLPTWVGPVVVVLLFAAGGVVAVVRRRGSPAP